MAIFEYGQYSDVYEQPDNLVDFFEQSAARYADNQFIGEKDAEGQYQWVTYRQIARRIDDLRGGFYAAGVRAGDTVGIIANNRKEWFIGEIAAQGLGAAYVPMYEKELVSMWKYIIRDAEVKVLLGIGVRS